MPPSNSNRDDTEVDASDDSDIAEKFGSGVSAPMSVAESSGNTEISDLERTSGFSEVEDDEPDFRPFNREAKYPHETKIYFGVLGGLLLGAHLEYISVWWMFAWSIGIAVPGEVKKVRKYGFEAYLEALHFKRPSLKDFGIIVSGLVLVIVLLTIMSVGFITADMYLSGGESSLVGSGENAPNGGHLLSDAVMNWWIYGLGIVIMFLVVGPAEELMFRHNMQGFMKKHYSTPKAILWTNIVFALLHLPVIIFVPNLLLMMLPLLGIFTLGSVFSIQYEYTDNLFVPSVTHSIWNSFVLTLLLIGVS